MGSSRTKIRVQRLPLAHVDELPLDTVIPTAGGFMLRTMMTNEELKERYGLDIANPISGVQGFDCFTSAGWSKDI